MRPSSPKLAPPRERCAAEGEETEDGEKGYALMGVEGPPPPASAAASAEVDREDDGEEADEAEW